MRAKERDVLRSQIKDTELDFIYPIPKEVGNLWNAPSDGSSFKFSGFEEYYFFMTDQNNSKPARKEAWKTWKKDMIGK
jgi:hypothetical protein